MVMFSFSLRLDPGDWPVFLVTMSSYEIMSRCDANEASLCKNRARSKKELEIENNKGVSPFFL